MATMYLGADLAVILTACKLFPCNVEIFALILPVVKIILDETSEKTGRRTVKRISRANKCTACGA